METSLGNNCINALTTEASSDSQLNFLPGSDSDTRGYATIPNPYVHALTILPTPNIDRPILSGMGFRKFPSLMYDHFSKDGRILEFCLNAGSSVSLLSEEYRLGFFDYRRVYHIADGQRLRCEGVVAGELISRDCIEPEIEMRTKPGQKLSISGEVHVVSDLPYDMIIGTDIMKPNNINIQ